MKLGDVIFQNLPCIWLVNLINQVQGKGPHHCGIVTGFWLGMPMITEAFFFGVWTIPLPLFILRWPFGVKFKSWVNQSLVSAAVAYVLSKKGTPYDIYYSDSDSAYYCSEIICKAFQAAVGEPISITETVASVEMSDEPAKSLYYHYLGKYPDPDWKIWLVNHLLNAKELS